MKTKMIVAALVAASSLSAANAIAGGIGQVNFTGAISDDTCTIVNTVSNPLDVTLGTYSSKEFTAVGDATAKVGFDIALTACPVSVTAASVNFDGTTDATNADLLALTAGTGVATGVGIQMYDEDGAELAIHTASKSYPLVTGDNNLPFYAAYKSTAATVTAGTANSVANFSIIYN
ncbi:MULTISPECIES: fimbrial protein [Enterobacter]|uniref:fimbrial protein n=1 Tax=Enterobacter TaxID=547 RepID=UPI0021D30B2D|nr:MULTISPECIES: fimbrial protein [Enterobacter]MCU6161717.1 fimbrial protein [Enterobacter bugandensis]MCU6208165.1 fimbrial protein [Enterobacter cloacae]